MDQYSLDDHEDFVVLRTAWEQVLRRLVQELPAAWIDRFFRPLHPKAYKDGIATFAVPGRFVQEWVRERYQGKLEQMLSDELGTHVQIVLNAEAREKVDVAPASAQVSQPAVADSSSYRPVEKYSFENFVVGQSNRLAFAGAKAVASDPGAKYNPLFIYGPSGLGKTHLLHSIARDVVAKDPKYGLAYVSAQSFSEEFVHALQSGRIEQFRRSQRNVAIWLVDDIQFVAGRDRTQEEVFHTFNYLHSLGKQIVLTSDRPPRDLYLMDERLRSRFESGLVADIQMPDTETRCAIILSKAKQDQIDLPTEVAMVLAEHVPGNIRILEGALNKLVAQSSINDIALTCEFAAEMIEQHYKSGTLNKPSFGQILEAVSRQFQISIDEIKGIRRNAPIVQARHVAVYITREITGDSWKHIGSLFGDRDHTSMMHGYQKVNELMHHDKELRSTVRSLLRSLNPDR